MNFNTETPEDEEERVITISESNPQDTLELIKRFPDVAVYGLLLTQDPKHPISQMLRDRWSRLHHLTGSRFLLVVFQPPSDWSENIKDFWKEQLGEDFEKTWQYWQKGLDSGIAYDYLDLFESPIKPSQLPCLVLFTDPVKRNAVIVSIPNWDVDSLYRFFTGMVEAIKECYKLQPDKRLECIRSSLASPNAKILSQLDHMKDMTAEYLKQNPAQTIITTVSFVLALATANVLPLSLSIVSILKVVKDHSSR